MVQTVELTLSLPDGLAHKLTTLVKKLVETGMDEEAAFSEVLNFAMDEMSAVAR
jgi:peptide subunit release factor 1 (eRF1)